MLQEQSVTACADPAKHVAGATRLAAEAKAVGASVLVYGTWPRRAGDAIYEEACTGGSQAAFEQCLGAGFASATAASGAQLVDAGAVWLRAIAIKPEIQLYVSDGSHPTALGTYLAACVFARALTGERAAHLAWHPPSIRDADARWLASIADGS
ncbi:MAG: hypothetical protein ACHREM_14320 [Polyangiales bacterium]